MKKFMLSLFFMVGIFVLASQGELLWSSRMLLDETRVHKIQKGESLSQLAKRYYGDPQRWRELALVNRAPNPNLVLPGEDVLVPAVGPINEMRRARTITKFNALVGEQERLAVVESSEASRQFTGSTAMSTQEPVATTTPAPTGVVPDDNTADGMVAATDPVVETPLTEEETSAGFPWFWLAVGVILIGGIFAFMRHRQRSEKQDDVVEENSEPISHAERVLRERRRTMEGAPSQA